MVGKHKHRFGTFGMSQHRGSGVLFFEVYDTLNAETCMHMAGAVP